MTQIVNMTNMQTLSGSFSHGKRNCRRETMTESEELVKHNRKIVSLRCEIEK